MTACHLLRCRAHRATLALAAVGAALLLPGCAREREPDGDTPATRGAATAPDGGQARAAATAEVARQDLRLTVAVKGEVIAPPSDYAEVRAPFTAPVDRVFVTVGAPVKKGEVLLQLSYPNAEAYYAEAQEELRQARAEHADAEQRFDAYVAYTRGELNEAVGALSATRTTYHRVVATDPQSPDIPTLRGALQQAILARTSARESYEEALAYKASSMALYEQRLEAAEAAFASAQSGVKQASVRSPIDGQVLAINAVQGRVLGSDPNTPAVVICDLSALRVHAHLDVDQAGVVDAEMPVKLTFDTLPGRTFEGEVRSVRVDLERQVETAGKGPVDRYLMDVAFDNTAGLVKPRMVATAAVDAGQAEDVLVVPANAVQTSDEGRPVVTVQRDGEWRPVVVELGLVNDRVAEVRSGLREGEVVRLTS